MVILIFIAAIFVGTFIYDDMKYRKIVRAKKAAARLSEIEEREAEEEAMRYLHQYEMREALCRAHREIERAGGAGFRPWIASCIDNYDRLTKDVAQLALVRTGQEIDRPECWCIIDRYLDEIEGAGA